MKNKLYAFINALGLSIAIALSFLVFLYIQDEKSFDQWHVHKNEIFRLKDNVLSDEPTGESKYEMSVYLPALLAPTIKEELSEVVLASRFSSGKALIERNGIVFNESIKYVDPDFFKMFSLETTGGNPDRYLQNDTDVIISQNIAEKYFPGEAPVNKDIKLTIFNEEKIFTVAGVFEDIPENTSLAFDILVNMTSRPYYENNMKNWGSFSYPTFIQLQKGTNLKEFDNKLGLFYAKYFDIRLDRVKEKYNLSKEEPAGFLSITNLKDIHWEHEVSWGSATDPQYMYILGAIAILIMIIACINYVTLSLTSAATRKVEVGVRKVVGAERGHLINQFMMESQILALIALSFALVLVVTFLPYFNEFTSKDIAKDSVWQPGPIAFVLCITLVVGFLAGGYPSFVLSAFKPILALKNKTTSKLNAGFSRTLVVIQFSLSIFLVICSLVMFKQMKFITGKDLGYSGEQVIVVPTYTGWSEDGEKLVNRFRNHLATDPDIVEVSGTSVSFSNGWSRYGYDIEGVEKEAYVYRIDPFYIDLLNIELVAGRNFDPVKETNIEGLIVNEALVKDMQWENPLEEMLDWKEDSIGVPIIGVVKDYHFLSLEHEIEPMILTTSPDNGMLTTMMIKFTPGDIPLKMAKVEAAWKELAGDKPFDYSFLDEDVAGQYKAYEKWSNIMGLSTVFAILIACLGLFGLAGINAVNKTKEIGIRKVLGAEVIQILYMLNKQYVVISLIAFLIAIPLSWYVMDTWLANFNNATSLGWSIFASAMVIELLLALITVSYHGLRAANEQPVKALKYE